MRRSLVYDARGAFRSVFRREVLDALAVAMAGRPPLMQAPPTGTARVYPYAHAPRLPEGDRVDVRTLVSGARFELEIGPGRGGFLFERAEAAPDAGLVGLEVRRKWATIVDDRLAKRGLGARARVFAEDARSALPRLGPDGLFSAVFVHFPDPWWKKRHRKRKVIGDVLVAELARLLAPAGELFMQTDVAERCEEYETRLFLPALFDPAGDTAGSPRLAENPYEARSPRERRAMADGLPIYRLRFVRKGE